MKKTDHRKSRIRLESTEEIMEYFPYLEALTDQLRFFPGDGKIWLGDDRVALFHLSTINNLRIALIKEIGIAETKGVLTRFGYHVGSLLAQMTKNIEVDGSDSESYLLGPQVHTLLGMARVEPLSIEADYETRISKAKVKLIDSIEAKHHLHSIGLSEEPVCWFHAGVASGYTSTFLGRAMIFKESQCCARGDADCILEGQSTEEWNYSDIEHELDALKAHFFSDKPDKKSGNSGGDEDTIILNMVGSSSSYASARNIAEKVATTETTVLLLGETGVGKSQFAKLIHLVSRRSDMPFVAVNCSAIPENLIEAELFGVKAGAFTGANRSRLGKFEKAQGGTLFLDEIGTLSLSAQVKLLRVIQEREIEPIGGTETVKIDVRLIAATNIDLTEAVQEGVFRKDLFYRINVFSITIPPLVKRREDLPLLMDFLLKKFSRKHGKNIRGFTKIAIDELYRYPFPGNIRELENLIERAVITTDDGNLIRAENLFIDESFDDNTIMEVDRSGGLIDKDLNQRKRHEMRRVVDSDIEFEEFENGILQAAIRANNGNISKAAEFLGVKRTFIDYRIKKSKKSDK